MLKTFQKRDVMVRIFLGFVVGIIGLTMVITLAPGPVGSLEESSSAVADVGGEPITLAEVQRQLSRIERRQSIPRPILALYARQIVDQMISSRLLELEARRLGLRVSDAELAERIKLLVPGAYSGDTFVGRGRYSAEVQGRFEMSVTEFEELIRQSLLEEKFRSLVTDGISVTPLEVEMEFRRRNEKVRLEYVLVRPEELESRVPVEEAALASYFEKNKTRYQVPERRSLRYALLETQQLRQRVAVTHDELRAYYNEHLDRYRVQNRARVSHILFKTIGKTDAEVEEIRIKAEGVWKKLRKGGPGAKFDELAKQNSEDTTRDAGGDLGWIFEGQTVPEFEKAAFTLPKGAISDLVKTQYGFHIIRVADRETARTQSFEEVRGSIAPILTSEKVERLANQQADQLTRAVSQSNRRPLDELAREFSLPVAESQPVGAGESVVELGPAPELVDALFRLAKGELSSPVRTSRGYVVFTVKDILPSHQGTLAEVRDRVTTDFRKEKATELAKARAEELARRAQSGEKLAQAAKALGFEAKTSEPVARTGSVPELGSARQLAAAFTMPVGATSPPTFLSPRWLVYRLVAREEAKPEEMAKQFKDIEQQVLQNKRTLAYEAFKTALEQRFKREGQLQINDANLRRLTSPT